MPVSPADAGAQIVDAEPFQPFRRCVEGLLIMPVNPLANAEALREVFQREFRLVVFGQQAKIEVPVVGTTLALFMPCGRNTMAGKIKERVPVGTLGAGQKQFGSAL